MRSRLSQSTVAQDDDDESDGDPGVPNYDYGDDGADMEIDSPPPPPSRTPQASRTPRHTQTPRRPSFATLAEEGEPDDQPADWSIDDIGDGDVEEDQPLSAKSRGKQRASAVRHADEVDEMDVEHEIAQGLNDAELEPIPEEDEPVEEQLPPPKKGKKGRAAKNSRKENEGVPRGRPRTKKDVLREGMSVLSSLYALFLSVFTVQLLQRRTQTDCGAASAESTRPSHGGGSRRLCMGDARMAHVLFQALRRSTASPRSHPNLLVPNTNTAARKLNLSNPSWDLIL